MNYLPQDFARCFAYNFMTGVVKWESGNEREPFDCVLFSYGDIDKSKHQLFQNMLVRIPHTTNRHPVARTIELSIAGSIRLWNTVCNELQWVCNSTGKELARTITYNGRVMTPLFGALAVDILKTDIKYLDVFKNTATVSGGNKLIQEMLINITHMVHCNGFMGDRQVVVWKHSETEEELGRSANGRWTMTPLFRSLSAEQLHRAIACFDVFKEGPILLPLEFNSPIVPWDDSDLSKEIA
jgi:hypothetical protein